MTLFGVDLEIGVIWADGNLCIILVEGECRDWTNVELVNVGRHGRTERRQTGREGSPLAARNGEHGRLVMVMVSTNLQRC
jgi:hypothetical protein